jgi:hypothetical protein
MALTCFYRKIAAARLIYQLQSLLAALEGDCYGSLLDLGDHWYVLLYACRLCHACPT